MARLAMDSSDDDLPDLSSVLKSKPQLTKSRATTTASSKESQFYQDASTERAKSSAKAPSAKIRDTSIRGKSLENVTLKSTTRRRILKPATENPLLLPFSSDKRPRTTKTKTKENMEPARRLVPAQKEVSRARSRENEMRELSSDDDLFKNIKTEGLKESTKPKSKTVMAKEVVARPIGRHAKYTGLEISEDEDIHAEESSGMSDFVVEDEESLFEYSEDEEDPVLPSPPPPPKSVRKLVRGRRPERQASTDEKVLGQTNRSRREDTAGDLNELGRLVSRINIQNDVESEVDGSDNDVCPKSESENESVTKRGAIPSRRIRNPPPKKQNTLPPSSFEQPSAILQL